MKRRLCSILFALITVASSVGLFACDAGGEANDVELTFVVNGEVHNNVLIQDDTTITIPDELEVEGYVFDGWYLDEGKWEKPFNSEYLAQNPIKKNKLVYAKMDLVEYNIIYLLNGGKNSADNPLTYTVEDAIVFAPPTKNGDEFERWSISGIEQGTTGDITVTAYWKTESASQSTVNYYVKYFLEDANSDNYSFSQQYSDTKAGSVGATVSASARSINGFKLNSSRSTLSGKVSSNSPLTLSLYYDRERYNITFSGNGGCLSSGAESQTIKYEGSLAVPTYSRNNCTFAGWVDGKGNTYKDNASLQNIDLEDGESLNLTILWTITNPKLPSRVLGMDISAHQKGIDWDDIAKKVNFVIIRGGYTGYGTGLTPNKDECFEDFYAKGRARNIPMGVYYYSCANTYQKGVNEATFLINNCLKGKTFEYPIFMDVEDAPTTSYFKNKENATQGIKGFVETLEKNGYYAGIYANKSYFANYIDCAEFSRLPFWMAQYKDSNTTTEPSFPVSGYSFGMWQYSADGYKPSLSVGGKVNLDANFVYYDYPTMIKLAGKNGFSAVTASTTKKSNEEIAREVINGLWGNGDERRNRLIAAGYDPTVIQQIVNDLLA